MAIIGKRLIIEGADFSDVAIESGGSVEPVVYSINYNISNGTYSGPSTIQQNASVTVTITPNSGFELPELSGITVTNAAISSYNNGTLVIINPYGNVSITAVCPITSSGGDTPSEVDVTSLFTWTQGAIVVDSTNANYAGNQTNQTVYRASSTFIDLTQYTELISSGAKLKISFPAAININHTKYGLLFYSSAAKSAAISGSEHMMEYDPNYFSVYRVFDEEFDIPVNAQYVKTTWIPEANESELGVTFSAKIVKS